MESKTEAVLGRGKNMIVVVHLVPICKAVFSRVFAPFPTVFLPKPTYKSLANKAIIILH